MRRELALDLRVDKEGKKKEKRKTFLDKPRLFRESLGLKYDDIAVRLVIERIIIRRHAVFFCRIFMRHDIIQFRL